MRYLPNRTYAAHQMVFIFRAKPVIPILIITLAGCAASGVNHRPQVSNSDIANYEIDLKGCQEQAANREDLENSAAGAVAGAAAGAIVGAMGDGGDIITSAVIGAIVGGAGGTLYSRNRQRQFIIECMQDLGYNVVAGD